MNGGASLGIAYHTIQLHSSKLFLTSDYLSQFGHHRHLKFFIIVYLFFQVLVAPPLYQQRPHWYQKDLAQIASRFSSTLTAAPVANLHLLPSFISQDLMPDGIFLNPVSGLHYVINLFDSAQDIINTLGQSSDVKISSVQESVRRHEDRLSYLECRHGDLTSRNDLKFAADAEFSDWMINRSNEDWLTILGLPRLSVEGKREWQKAVLKQVTEVIKLVLKINRSHLDFSALVAVNPIPHRKNGMTVVNVKINSVETARRLRDIFSGFFRQRNRVPLPPALKGVSFRNKVTKDTRIRIAILQQLGARYQATNPGSSIHVKGYDPRPTLVTFPGSSSGSGPGGTTGGVRSYTFMEAVKTLPPNLSDEALGKIFQIIGPSHEGDLRAYFVILSDDDRERCQGLVQPRGPQPAPPAPGPSFRPTAPQVTAGRASGAGLGMDLSVGFLDSLRAPPPPPPPGSPPPSRRRLRSTPSRVSRSISPAKRGLKRRHQDEDRHGRKKRTRRSKPHKKSSHKSRSRRSPSSSSSSSSSRSPSPSRSASSSSSASSRSHTTGKRRER